MTTGKTVGLTTGQAARYCLVSPDTIANWIKARELPAQRTIGGQYRILVDELRQFMVQNEMSTALLDAELECHPYCWEHWAAQRKESGQVPVACGACPVYRARALNCFELRATNGGSGWTHADCQQCAYFQEWGSKRRDA